MDEIALALKELMAMRAASGTAIGNMTMDEIRMLPEASATERGQSYEDWYRENFGGGMPDELRNNYKVLYGDRWSSEIEKALEERYAYSQEQLKDGYPGTARNTSMDGDYR